VSRFLFLPLGAHGHINPTLAVAATLVDRGHEVVYLQRESFRPQIEATGARLVPVPGEPAAGAPVPDADLFGQLLERVISFTEDVAAPLRALHTEFPADLVVTEQVAVWGALHASATGIPRVQLSPTYVFDGTQQAPPVAADRAETLLHRLARAGRDYGLPDVDARTLMQWSGPTIVFLPPGFQPGATRLERSVTFVGPSLGRPEHVGRFPLPAPGAVLVSLGTVFHAQPGFFAACVTALGAGERPVVVSHGGSAADLPDVPATVTLAAHVPQLAVLDRCAAFVTHGGMNSTMEAIAAGVPMVVVPQMFEQELTAQRVAELGLGVHLPPADVTPDALAAAVAAVLDDPGYRERVAALGAAARAAGGAARAADLLEKEIVG
jgi:MGT family glycosyltransferase